MSPQCFLFVAAVSLFFHTWSEVSIPSEVWVPIGNGLVPAPITTEAEYKRMLAQVEILMQEDEDAMSREQQAILELLTTLPDDVQAELERLRAENAALKARTSRGVSLKVSEKGAVSVYGLGRFPVTLYKEQWTKLLDMADEISAFITEHAGELKAKES